MSDSHLEIKIEGPGVSPATVALRDLLDLLDSFEQAVQATAKGRGEIGAALVSLVGVAEGSDLLTMHANTKAVKATEAIVHAITSQDSSRLSYKAEECLRQIWRRASDRHWTIGIANSKFSAVISPSSDLFKISRVKGTTSIGGQLRRIGGISPTAQLLLGNNELLTVHLEGEDMAKGLSHSLYDFIALEGEATWIVPGWKIDDFRATKILPVTHSTVDAPAAFQLIADVAPGVWDTIDPDSFVRDQRDDPQQ